MPRIAFISLCFLMTAFGAHAGDLESLQSVYEQSHSWQAGFKQKTFVKLLGRSVEKNGNIFIKKPDKIRIEYDRGEGKEYVSNGKKLVVYEAELREAKVYNPSKILAKEALSFLGGLGKLSREFNAYPISKGEDLKGFKSNDLRFMELIPKNPNSIIDRIVLGFDASYVVREFLFINESGNRTHYVFEDIRLNANLSDASFEFIRPEGVREVKGR